MKIRILGSGGSFGVPLIGNYFGKCDKRNPKNYRTRPSILIKINKVNLLIDSGPDIRIQLLNARCNHLDAVLYTHNHADHIHGINDLRAFFESDIRWLEFYGFDPLDIPTNYRGLSR